MPLGIVSDFEFESELEKTNSIHAPKSSATVVDKSVPGRSNGDNNVPDSLRKVIGEEAITTRAGGIELAKNFGISPPSVDAYKNGATSPASYNNPSPSLASHIDKVREKVTKKASNRLILALNSITSEKLLEVKPRDAAGIAKDMSVIIKNMEPESDLNTPKIGPNFVFYSPRRKSEEDYEVIKVDE
jgi:hypothetical protein